MAGEAGQAPSAAGFIPQESALSDILKMYSYFSPEQRQLRRIAPQQAQADVSKTQAETGLLGGQAEEIQKQLPWIGREAAANIARTMAETRSTNVGTQATQASIPWIGREAESKLGLEKAQQGMYGAHASYFSETPEAKELNSRLMALDHLAPFLPDGLKQIMTQDLAKQVDPTGIQQGLDSQAATAAQQKAMLDSVMQRTGRATQGPASTQTIDPGTSAPQQQKSSGGDQAPDPNARQGGLLPAILSPLKSLWDAYGGDSYGWPGSATQEDQNPMNPINILFGMKPQHPSTGAPSQSTPPAGAPTSMNGSAGGGMYPGLATMFGLNPDGSVDKQDNGVGAWGANTRDPNLAGVAVHPEELQAMGIPQSQWPNVKVAVTNPSTGKSGIFPNVDKLGNPNAGVDLTYGAGKQLGATGADHIVYHILNALAQGQNSGGQS
jgi:hypothetical protein